MTYNGWYTITPNQTESNQPEKINDLLCFCETLGNKCQIVRKKGHW